MQSEDRRAAICSLGGAGCLLLAIALNAVSAQPDTNWHSRVSADLLQIYRPTTNKSKAGSLEGALPQARFDSSGRVQIAAYFDCALPAPDNALAALGLAISASVKIPPYCVVEGWTTPETLPGIASVTAVTLVKLPVYSRRHQAGVDSQSAPKSAMPAVVSARPTEDKVKRSSIDGAAINIMHTDVYAQ